jgi:hypothetical protein
MRDRYWKIRRYMRGVISVGMMLSGVGFRGCSFRGGGGPAIDKELKGTLG